MEKKKILAKKVANYKVKDILENFKEFINLVEKYKQDVQVKTIYKYNDYAPIENLSEFISIFGYLYFTMGPYKKYKFSKFIEKLNNEKCFMLSILFDNLNKLRYIEFKYKNNP